MCRKEDLMTRKMLDKIYSVKNSPNKQEKPVLNGDFIVTYTFVEEKESTINDFKKFLEDKNLVYAEDQSTYFGGTKDMSCFEQELKSFCSKISNKSKVYLYHIDPVKQNICRIKILPRNKN
jgi:hypothetical protein